MVHNQSQSDTPAGSERTTLPGGDRTLTFDEFAQFFADNKDALAAIPDGDIVVEVGLLHSTPGPRVLRQIGCVDRTVSVVN
jgi:hypothetical protein